MWGATPVTESVAEVVPRRTGVRWLAAYGASELPVIAANPVGDPAAWRLDSPGCRPPASSCGWPTSTPARSSPPAGPARSRPAARR